MLLQVSKRNGKIQVSDGENFAYFRYGREKETFASLCKQINHSANLHDLERSLFLFNNFSFSFSIDGSFGSDLIISLECDEYFCVSPNNYLERHKRDSYIELVLSSQRRSEYFSRAKKNPVGKEGKSKSKIAYSRVSNLLRSDEIPFTVPKDDLLDEMDIFNASSGFELQEKLPEA